MTENERLRQLEDKLWKAADQLRANSSLAASQYAIPVLGLIFLRYADVRFTQLEKGFAEKATGRREIGKADYQAQGVMYMPETARFSYLRGLAEGSDIGGALNRAMETIETENPDLKGDSLARRPASESVISCPSRLEGSRSGRSSSNLVGSILLGFFVARGTMAISGPLPAQFWGIGVLGSFTTFSAFGLERAENRGWSSSSTGAMFARPSNA